MQQGVTMHERRLCIVLLDLIGSTAFVQKYGAHHAARHFQRHDRLARSLLYKYNGREIDRSDGFLCSFDSAVDAVNFGLAYQSTIPRKTGLQCRIGMHWGPIVEVHQDDVFVAANAKRIELEGLSKNIAARTMSLCGPGQVLLTRAAVDAIRGRANQFTPHDTRYACVGLYRFKGVREPLEVHAVATDIRFLQPPPGNEKVKRLGGPKYIKLRARDRKIKDWIRWALRRAAIALICFLIYAIISLACTPFGRDLLGISTVRWIPDTVYYIRETLDLIRRDYNDRKRRRRDPRREEDP